MRDKPALPPATSTMIEKNIQSGPPTMIMNGNVYEADVAYLCADHLTVIQLCKVIEGRSLPLDLLSTHEGDLTETDPVEPFAALVHEAERRGLEPPPENLARAVQDDAFIPDAEAWRPPHPASEADHSTSATLGAPPSKRTVPEEIDGIYKISSTSLKEVTHLDLDGTRHKLDWTYFPEIQTTFVVYESEIDPERRRLGKMVDGHLSERRSLGILSSKIWGGMQMNNYCGSPQGTLQRVTVLSSHASDVQESN